MTQNKLNDYRNRKNLLTKVTLLFHFAKRSTLSDPPLILTILIYIISIAAIITWGIPNDLHPFNYHMDEWHQLQSVRALFKYGSPNIAGAAHGSIFQFFLSGIYLVPFMALGIINPFIIHSSLENMVMQEKIFIVLRTNTLIFGIMSIVVLSIIAKKYLKVSPFIAVLLFTFTPIWLSLSNYFKYDIALIFWILASLLCIIRYSKSPTAKNYLIAAIPVGLSFATKISAAPIILVYIFSYFYFSKRGHRNYRHLINGVLLCTAICVFFGIPDLIFRLDNWKEFLTSNLAYNPHQDGNYLLGTTSVLKYQLFTNFPKIFGLGFYALFVTSFGFWTYKITKLIISKSNTNKIEMFLYFSFLIFAASLIPLRLGATGNRVLVLLPFMSLLSMLFVKYVLKTHIKYKVQVFALLTIIIVSQMYYSSLFITSKLTKSPQQQSSEWMLSNIPRGKTIGLENIPIYQSPPDIVLKEFYLSQENNKAKTTFKYEIIEPSTKRFPEYIVLTGRKTTESIKISTKKDLIGELTNKNYQIVAEFESSRLVSYFGNDLIMHLSALTASPMVTIYKAKR